MQALNPHLVGFLEGLCAASVTHYPEYGMFLRGPVFGDDVTSRPSAQESASVEKLRAFFQCALSDTSASRPEDASHVVERFLELVRRFHPDASLHCEVPETQGWFDGLEVWLTTPSGTGYFLLDWSVS